MLNAGDLGWVAGTLDLKGRVQKKNNPQRATPHIVLLVETKERHVVTRLAALTGTDPVEQSPKELKKEWNRRGCAEHCPDHHVHIGPAPNMPTISRWQVTGSAMVVVLYNVLPYLTNSPHTALMRDSMEAVASTIPLKGQGRAAIDRAIRRLSGLGWQIPSYIMREGTDEES